MPNTKSWRTVRGQRPLDEERIADYQRVIAVELALAEMRRRRGVSQAALAEALEVTQPNISRIEAEDDVYLSTLARYVAALGARLEVRAVFEDETITVLREPAQPR